ncbi:hypothetical protein A2W54_03480 [Candidatus Giovannonibacteria bacterium RIFCSPHIGHO2_02_43_13]|uniref:Methylisocitrate lyase n=1 Tax=Candidatus Giovannonibacteria bacterium RIFCSPHIGHO2_02_43_13 TaxID=1798330 RepID=A0A1F5WQH4_9BACT|nr:MAG: hypothetical protein A3E06_00690 [Candidatus Giovannonibacteria bacterium RIFCSPHIGHO2_12_FULL_44_42]OGF77837.1 MAG: hypothetical protein A2W54_03480 [Candidatus Giovannonibacteria bacterium RIFCSPHIGHO2_02_43_13]OGF88827.1 MAG: hypothetical protein A3I94_02375 [Candidatus Giovannonibacteria bacterium RIFCSPLOWO2_02_FULL_43_54]OGF96791.1 MAG: hypothetical protein A3H08_01265 [Candidatus Giovannonibacteria bacterium RIFCSPLOWO2_12_FULL_44_32]
MAGRKTLRELLSENENLILPGILSPIEALLAEKADFKACYISGAALSTSLGFLDEGKITLARITSLVREIRRASDMPLLVDCDTGFQSIAKTVKALEASGASAVQIEDQVPSEKRCGHLDAKKIIPIDEMEKKIKAAVSARKNQDFLIVARTDSRATDGLSEAKWRGYGYKQAGADIIFPEALESEDEFRIFGRDVINIPLAANMAEGGKSPSDLTAEKLFVLGYQIVLIPVTPLRLTLKYFESILTEAAQTGSLKNMIEKNGLISRNEMIDFIKNNSKVYTK